MFGKCKTGNLLSRDFGASPLIVLCGASDFYAPHHHFAFLISNFSFDRDFQTQSRNEPHQGLTLNPFSPIVIREIVRKRKPKGMIFAALFEILEIIVFCLQEPVRLYGVVDTSTDALEAVHVVRKSVHGM